MENIVEKQPVTIETMPTPEVTSPIGEVAVPQNILPINPKPENKPVEPVVTTVKIENKPSIGYPLNNSEGSKVVTEKMNGELDNL